MSRPTTRSCREIFTTIAAPPRIRAKRSATTRRRSGSTRVTRSPMRSCRSRRRVWPTATAVLRRKKDKRRSQKPVPRRSARSSWIQISPMRIRHKARSCELVDFNFAGAEAEYRRALELAPQNAGRDGESRHPAGHTWPARRSGRARSSGRLRSSRYAARSHTNLALYLTALGRYDEAEAALRKAIELQPQSARTTRVWR